MMADESDISIDDAVAVAALYPSSPCYRAACYSGLPAARIQVSP